MSAAIHGPPATGETTTAAPRGSAAICDYAAHGEPETNIDKTIATMRPATLELDAAA